MEEINRVIAEGTEGLCELLEAYMNGADIVRELIDEVNGRR